MTRARAKEAAEVMKAYAEGNPVQIWSTLHDCWEDLTHLEFDFQWKDFDYRIKPVPKKRLMTRDEVLGFVANTLGIVASYSLTAPKLASQLAFLDSIEAYTWATISPDGKLGEFQPFEIDE